MRERDLTTAEWRKSTHSNGDGGDCLEVTTCPGVVPVRDSKKPTGPVLLFRGPVWSQFIEDVVGTLPR
ncbi:DUF397 domain-containing protein [Streptomyces sp. NPDC007088]|uniref:DUF397 domain-containing protein n=1 Tax=Streptomyces sp. NPDC007088 TaxID=3364773 RepID=UPI0036C85733